MTDAEALLILTARANKYHDGHFTLLKFTTNWRCQFGTCECIKYMPVGDTMVEAIAAAIENSIIDQSLVSKQQSAPMPPRI